MKEFINNVYVTGIANGQLLEGHSCACVSYHAPCPPVPQTHICQTLCTQINALRSGICCVENCMVQVTRKCLQYCNCKPQLIIDYTICLTYRDILGCRRTASYHDYIIINSLCGNVTIDAICVSVANPPCFKSFCHMIQITAPLYVCY